MSTHKLISREPHPLTRTAMIGMVLVLIGCSQTLGQTLSLGSSGTPRMPYY